MAHSLSAKKRVRQDLKRNARNRARKEVLKDQTKAFHASIAKGDPKAAEVEFNKTTRVLDKVAAKGTLHKNTASRKRSRLARHLNTLKTKATAGKA